MQVGISKLKLTISDSGCHEYISTTQELFYITY